METNEGGHVFLGYRKSEDVERKWLGTVDSGEGGEKEGWRRKGLGG